jgi:hypothetical protein
MKRIILLLLITISTQCAFGQVIQGSVLDRESGEAVDFASVFFNGTFHGTTTNELGKFELDVTEYKDRTLYISAVGYKTASLKFLQSGTEYKVLLEKARYRITEVSVESESLVRERERCLKIFKDEFLGRSSNAKNCYILNEEDLSFNYQTNHDTLRAVARSPLVILNKALGYQITYYLDKFEYDRIHKTTAFTGNIIFNLDLATTGKSKTKFESKRKKTYLGSCKHFFTALWMNNLEAEGFRVQEVDSYYPQEYEAFVRTDPNGKKYFSYGQDLEIAYDRFLTRVSFQNRAVSFGTDGFFEPEAIKWYGYMAMARIADWLPYEYTKEK